MVVVPARQATKAGGIDSLQSIPGAPLHIRALSDVPSNVHSETPTVVTFYPRLLTLHIVDLQFAVLRNT